MLDVEPLLKPLSPKPTGPNLRRVSGDTTFSKIKDFESEVEAAVSPTGKDKPADWKAVFQECERALGERSKDLDLAAHLTAALVHLEGFEGLRSGLELTRELLTRYWDEVHPGVEDGAVTLEARARPLTWLGTSALMLAAVKRVPLTSANGRPGLSWSDFEGSARMDKAVMSSNSRAVEELRASGLITGEAWSAAVRGTPPNRLRETVGLISACRDSLSALREACKERFGEETPDFDGLEDWIEKCLDHLGAQVNGNGNGTSSPPSEEVANGGTVQRTATLGPIASREQAYAALREAAAFLRQTEPHSPVPALVERALRWGEMEFEQLFRDVVRSDEAKREVWEVLGLKEQEHEST